jgi:uncharacterized protein
MSPTEHRFLTMSDGVRLAVTLHIPEDGGPWPAILEALPYRKNDDTASYRPEYLRLAAAGYVVCRADVRGTGTSEGVATDEYPAIERTDMATVIDWLATQPWSTGNVGMYGTSYSGFNCIQVAMERPPALKAIIPIYATDDRYADDVHYYGGARKQLDSVDYPTYMVAMNALPPVPALYGEGWHEEWERRVKTTEPWVFTWLEHQRYDDYWKYGSLREDYGAIEAATMIVAGWADGYTNNSLRTMERLTCPKRLIVGPWAHAATDTSIPGPNIDLVPEMLAWWDRWLKDEDNGVDREPPIILFARRSTKPAPELKELRGEWRYEPAWPAARTVERPFPLSGSGEGTDELEVRGDVGWTAWISCAGHMPWGLPDDQRPDEAFSLTYDWPVDDELEILGHPTLRATVTSSAPVAFLSAKLCDVFPDGTSALITRGMLNLSHRDSPTDPSPVEPGRAYAVTLPLEVTSWIVEPGHRLRLDIAGSDWPNAWAPPYAGTLAIEREGSVLTVPTLDGPSPVADRPVLAHARRDQEPAYPPGDGEAPTWGVTWRIERDVLAHETRAVVGSWNTNEGDGDVPPMTEDYRGIVAVSHDDPGIARAEGEARYSIVWPEATCESHVTSRIVSDADTYTVAIELKVSENGRERWTRRWDRTFPRDLQ